MTRRGALCLALLALAACFMTTAWYWQLRMKSWSLPRAVFLSWRVLALAFPEVLPLTPVRRLIAGGEYCLQVPANRMGSAAFGGPFSSSQLKVLAELFGLVAFSVFNTFVLRERLRWTDGLGFALILSGVAVAMLGRKNAEPPLAVAATELVPHCADYSSNATC